jgi:hypothetical protein
MKRVIATLVGAALVSGCFSVTYRNPALPPNGIVVDGSSRFFVFALIGNERIPVYQYCPGGVSSIETYLSFGDLLLHGITFGMFTPRSYEIRCGGGR